MEESRAPHLSERGRTCRLVAVVFASVSVPVRQFVAAPVGGRLETRFPSRCRVAREARVSSDCREEEREPEIVFAGVVGRVWCRGVERAEGWAPSVSIDPRMSRREGEKKKVEANPEGSLLVSNYGR